MFSDKWTNRHPVWKSAAMSAPLRLVLVAAVVLFHTIGTRGATLGYSTYFGAGLYEGAYAVAVDAAGNAYVAGSTDSTNGFPLLNALQPVFGGGNADAFLAKFDPDGHLIFSTYFGGTGYDAINDLALNPDGNVIVVGETRSVDLPSTDDAFQYDYAGGSAFGSGDGFIVSFSTDGAQLLYCSYFGGSGDEKINSLAITANGRLCVTGWTDSRDLPHKNSLQPTYGGGDSDGFIAQFDANLTNLIFSTYFGGEDRDEDQRIAVDPAGLIYLGGQTLSTNFPVTAGAFQTQHVVVDQIGGNWDGFITKFSADGTTLIYSTYVGDATGDGVLGIAADADGSAYVTGYISAGWDSGTFPLGFQPEPGYGGADAWVAKLKPEGSNFAWFSYLGGSGEDYGYDLDLDKSNNIYVTGITRSSDFPTRDATQPKYGGGTQDSFVAKISADGQQLVYSTYLGGSLDEWGYRLAVDAQGNAIVVGQTTALNFPIRNAIQTTNATLPNIYNPADAYITKITPAIAPPRLGIVRSGANVLLAWPTNFTGFALQSTPAIGLIENWQPVAANPLILGGQFTVIQRMVSTNQFFRLQRP